MGHERQRLEELKKYAILDSEPEEAFDRVTRVAKKIFDVPIALVSLIDENRQWFKSNQGLDVCETARDISFCTHAIKKNEPFVVPNALEDPLFKDNPLVTSAPNIRFYAGIPLTSPQGYNLGTLCIIDTKPRFLTSDQIDILRDLSRVVVDAFELRTLASLDCLTGLKRRNSFMAAATAEMARAERYGHNFSVIALDIDHFKQVNDRYGHAVGDLVLQHVAQICQANLRRVDTAGRFGGEEFIILLPETDLDDAIRVGERIRITIEDAVTRDSGNFIHVTTSVGVADKLGTDAKDVHTILTEADKMLYEAKSGGRNCTMPKVA